MRVISAYLLAVLGGNATPAAADIEKICKAGGVDVDAARVKAFLKELDGKTAEEIIAAGSAKLASMPAGGGGGGGGGGDAPAAAAPEAAKEESEEEEDEDMGFSLFD